MFFVRLFSLALATLITYLIGSGTNTLAAVCVPLFFIFAVWLYFLPTYEAWRTENSNQTAITLINLLAGWTLIGWLVAAAWALKRSDKPVGTASPEGGQLPPVAGQRSVRNALS